MYTEWLKAVKIISPFGASGLKNFPQVALLDQAVKECDERPSYANATKILQLFEELADSPKELAVIKGKKSYPEIDRIFVEVSEWAENLRWTGAFAVSDHAAIELGKSATTILTRFPMIPENMEAALTETFKNPDPDNAGNCFACYLDEFKWQKRVNSLQARVKGEMVDGFTIEWDQNNPACKTEHSRWTAPYNRSIEVPARVFVNTTGIPPSKGTLLHEMLHWVTHPEYKRVAEVNYGKSSWQGPHVFLKEGITEWLKRYATGDWNSGGYVDVFPIANLILSSEDSPVSKEAVMDAYFAGKDVSKVQEALINASSAYLMGFKTV